MMALEVLPTTLLMFPAGQAAIMAGLAMYGKVRHGSAYGAGQGAAVRGWRCAWGRDRGWAVARGMRVRGVCRRAAAHVRQASCVG